MAKFQVGSPIWLREEKIIGEIRGLYPSGQAGVSEDTYLIEFGAASMKIAERAFDQIFTVDEPEIKNENEPVKQRKQRKGDERMEEKKEEIHVEEEAKEEVASQELQKEEEEKAE